MVIQCVASTAAYKPSLSAVWGLQGYTVCGRVSRQNPFCAKSDKILIGSKKDKIPSMQKHFEGGKTCSHGRFLHTIVCLQNFVEEKKVNGL